MTAMYNIKCTSRVEGHIKTNLVTWTLPNFLMLLDNESCREFRTNLLYDVTNKTSDDTKFRIKLQFLGYDNDIVEICYQTSTSVFLKTILVVCLPRFEERAVKVKDYHVVTANQWQYLATFFKKDIKSDNNSFLLHDGRFRLKFSFILTQDVQVKESSLPESQLGDDLLKTLDSSLFSDCVIKSADGKEYETHKIVLASRSEVFRALFQHNMVECQSSVVDSHFDSTVLYQVLTFIYTDSAPMINDIPEKLLAAADYYQLPRLKALCEDALYKKLGVDNAIDILELAELHSALGLKKLTLDFIKDGQAKLITQTDTWKELKSVEIVKSIYEYLVSNDEGESLK